MQKLNKKYPVINSSNRSVGFYRCSVNSSGECFIGEVNYFTDSKIGGAAFLGTVSTKEEFEGLISPFFNSKNSDCVMKAQDLLQNLYPSIFCSSTFESDISDSKVETSVVEQYMEDLYIISYALYEEPHSSISKVVSEGGINTVEAVKSLFPGVKGENYVYFDFSSKDK